MAWGNYDFVTKADRSLGGEPDPTKRGFVFKECFLSAIAMAQSYLFASFWMKPVEFFMPTSVMGMATGLFGITVRAE